MLEGNEMANDGSGMMSTEQMTASTQQADCLTQISRVENEELRHTNNSRSET